YLLFLTIFFPILLSAADDHELIIHFKTGSDQLGTAVVKKLQAQLSTLKNIYPNYMVKVIGHTDNIGDTDYNKELSITRSREVAKYLFQQGFNRANISLQGQGLTQPLTSNDSENGRRLNRRVTIELKEIESVFFNGFDNKSQQPKEIVKFQAEQGTAYRTKRSGTMINIPPNSLIDKDGNQVNGEVELTFTEYRDAADFLLSGIPMDFRKGGEHFVFNSGGMFDVRAFQNGNELTLKEGSDIDVQFVLTSTVPDMNLYYFDDQSNNWRLRTTGLGVSFQSMAVGTNGIYRCSNTFALGAGDTVAMAKEAIDKGLELTKVFDVSKYSPKTLGLPTFEEQFSDMDYIGGTKVSKISQTNLGKKKSIRLFPFKKKYGPTRFKIVFRGGQKKDAPLKKFRKVHFKINDNFDESIFNRVFTDARVDVQNKSFLLTLKGDEGIETLYFDMKDVKVDKRYRSRLGLGKKKNAKIRYMKKKYNKALGWLKMKYNMQLETIVNWEMNKKFDAGFDMMDENLRSYFKPFMWDEEKCLTLEQWNSHFVRNRTMMYDRYLEVSQTLPKDEELLKIYRDYDQDRTQRYSKALAKGFVSSTRMMDQDVFVGSKFSSSKLYMEINSYYNKGFQAINQVVTSLQLSGRRLRAWRKPIARVEPGSSSFSKSTANHWKAFATDNP
ncbi:MAG: OmpA family protein, partial [Bacteroidetes bacterium]|nr:OmpA family protein [Bacteroidota bacterium]